MKRIKKTISFIMVLLICVTFLPQNVYADEKDEKVGDITYRLDNDGTATVTGCDGSLVILEIPQKVSVGGKSYIVDEIKSSSFKDNTSLISVVIPDSVVNAGSDAFKECTNLSSVTIGKGLTRLSQGMFYGCTSLTTITIPDTVTSIGTSAFKNCTALESVALNKGLTSIGQGTFQNCTKLTSITIPSTVTSIGSYAFEASGLTSITIPENVQYIGYYAFRWCNNLTSALILYNQEKKSIPNNLPFDINESFGNTPALANSNITHKLATPKNLTWTGSVASWDAIGVADSYSVQLFKDGNPVGSIVSTTDTSYDFSNLIIESGSYHFSVKAIASSTYVESDVANSVDSLINVISFDANDHGTAPTTQYIVNGGKVSKPSDLSETGYLFGGWYKEIECKNAWDFDTDVVNDSFVLYAKWTECDHSANINTLCTQEVICSACGKTIAALGHDFASTYTKTDENHYYACSRCDVKKDEEKHQYDNACDTTCNDCGYVRVITHDNSDLKHNENEHWYICSVCDLEQPNSRENHKGGTATCLIKAECTACKELYGELDKDNHSKDTFTYVDNKDGKTHTKKYDCCGKEVSENHQYGDDHICDLCTYEDIKNYDIIEGEKQKVIKGNDALFISEADFNKFVGVQVDGKDLDKSDYNVVSESTKVTLKRSFIDTLSVGEHTLVIISTDGSASTTFTVQEPPLTTTSDNNNILMYSMLMMSMMVVGTIVNRRKRLML